MPSCDPAVFSWCTHSPDFWSLKSHEALRVILLVAHSVNICCLFSLYVFSLCMFVPPSLCWSDFNPAKSHSVQLDPSQEYQLLMPDASVGEKKGVGGSDRGWREVWNRKGYTTSRGVWMKVVGTGRLWDTRGCRDLWRCDYSLKFLCSTGLTALFPRPIWSLLHWDN